MNRLRNAFEDRKAFIAYLTAGDPGLDTTKELILTMEQTGADIIEIGIPYKNIPTGLTDIVESNKRALDAGTTVEDIFNMILGLTKKIRVPVVVLAYLETIKEYGISRFMRKCKECNISGLVVPDLKSSQQSEISRDCDLFGVDLISVIHPGSREEIATIAKTSKGFIYCEASLEEVDKNAKIDFREMVAIIRANANVPCVMGFGITTLDQAKDMATISDGVVIVNGIVRTVGQYDKECIAPVREYVRAMRAALRQA